MGLDILPASIRDTWEIHERRHACAVLAADFPNELKDLIEVLSDFRLPRSFILAKGGNKSTIARGINGSFARLQWIEKKFNVRIKIDEHEHYTPTHKIDYFKNGIAVETEWNNKDPFYDRDLNNFRLLFEIHAVKVGIIITRASELQQLFNQLGKGKSYGQNTTHMGKLMPKVESNSGGGCPLLLFGITKKHYVDDQVNPALIPYPSDEDESEDEDD